MGVHIIHFIFQLRMLMLDFKSHRIHSGGRSSAGLSLVWRSLGMELVVSDLF